MPRSGSSSAAFLCAALVCGPSSAFEFLTLPVACTPGTDCAIASYFDAEPSAAAGDYTCGPMTYDGHTGVDFAVTDYAAMDAGVAVLAAAPGRVIATRDGQPDRRGTVDSRTVSGLECGNGVVIDHGNGEVTQYCHMRQGSIRVRNGQDVRAGEPIGLVGQSGNSEFPHLHFEVQLNGRPIDPFSGRRADGCGLAGIMSWSPETAGALPYFAGLPFHLGFAAAAPDAAAMRAGDYDGATLSTESPQLVFWAEMWGVVSSDSIRMTVTAPDGTILADNRTTIDTTQTRSYRFIGIPTQDDWPSGTYSGEVVYDRAADGHSWTRTVTVELRAP
ncbi:MAG: M23 family metallopeptidase [Alphaproteobacteria bacterium]